MVMRKKIKLDKSTISAIGIIFTLFLLLFAAIAFGIINPNIIRYALLSGLVYIISGIYLILETTIINKRVKIKSKKHTLSLIIGILSIMFGGMILLSMIDKLVLPLWSPIPIGIGFIILAYFTIKEGLR